MSTINTNVSGGYYQLNSSSGNSSQANRSANTTLATLLQATGSNNQAANNSAYLLDLSPEAQKYMAANNQQSLAGSILGGGTQAFTLSSKQREEITAVLVKYKDAPFTQETYNKIQDELSSKGLGGQQLSMIDKATSFNPTQILVGALTGKSTQDSDPSGVNSKAKIDNYMQQILGQWKNISTTVDDVAQETSSDAVQAAGGASEG